MDLGFTVVWPVAGLQGADGGGCVSVRVCVECCSWALLACCVNLSMSPKWRPGAVLVDVFALALSSSLSFRPRG